MEHRLNTETGAKSHESNICVPSVSHLWPKLLCLTLLVLTATRASAQEKTDWDAAYERLLKSNPEVREKVESGGQREALTSPIRNP